MFHTANPSPFPLLFERQGHNRQNHQNTPDLSQNLVGRV